MRTKEPPLDNDEIERRITLGSPALLKELFQIAQQQIAAEAGRQTRLDSKATSLLTAAGLSLTVAFTYGGQLILGHKQASDPAHLVFPAWAQWAFGIGVILGLAAAAFAICALFVRNQYLNVNERSVFDPAALAAAEEGHDPETPGSDVVGLAEYHKALIPHLWMISQQHGEVHQKKARLIKVGQGLFMGFILSLFAVCLSLLGNMS